MSIIDAYKPPYLFRGVRPQILNLAKTDYQRGETIHFDVARTNAPTSVVLQSTQAVTHMMNCGENRFLDLNFSVENQAVSAEIPDDSLKALPGWYLLWAMVDDIPSVAQIVRILPGKAAVSVKSLAFEPALSVFPNPASREIFLQTAFLGDERIRSVSMADVSGRIVGFWSGGLAPDADGRLRLALPDCPAGVYFLKMETGGKVLSRKVVLQN